MKRWFNRWKEVGGDFPKLGKVGDLVNFNDLPSSLQVR